MSEMRISDILRTLLDNCILEVTGPGNLISVTRDQIFGCATRTRAFKRRVDNGGVGEGAVDEGRPTREFLRLLMMAIQMSPIFEGPDISRDLAFDIADSGCFSTAIWGHQTESSEDPAKKGAPGTPSGTTV